MTALKIDGRTAIPASSMAKTKGEYLVEEDDAKVRRSSVDDRIRPRMNRLTT